MKRASTSRSRRTSSAYFRLRPRLAHTFSCPSTVRPKRVIWAGRILSDGAVRSNHALQRTRPCRFDFILSLSWAGSLSLGR